MKSWIHFIIMSGLALAGCAPRDLPATATLAPSSTPTPTNIETPIPTATIPTETPTETHQQTEIPLNMTWDNWKNLLETTLYARGDSIKNWSNVYQDTTKFAVINDPETVRTIQYGSILTVLRPDGVCRNFVEPEIAAQEIANGATAIAHIAGNGESGVGLVCLMLSEKQFVETGHTNIKVVFDEAQAAFEVGIHVFIKDSASVDKQAEGSFVGEAEIFSILTARDPVTGKLVSPNAELPKHFLVYVGLSIGKAERIQDVEFIDENGNKTNLEEALKGNPKDWVDILNKARVKGLLIFSDPEKMNEIASR